MSATMSTKLINSKSPGKWKPVSVVIGGILVHLSLGTLYTFGNFNPYLTSYMRKSGSSPNLTYTECSWIYALACMGQGSSMFLGGIIDGKLGPRLTTLLGGLIMSLGVFLSYFSVQHSFALIVFTYGLMYGIGIGIAYAVPMSCAMKWLPERKGLVNGFIVAGFGGGAFFFDQVQTAYINPHNLMPEFKIGDEKYFIQDELLNKVPSTFLILGACYIVMQLIGSMLLCYPPTVDQEFCDDETEEHKFAMSDRSDSNLLNEESQAIRGHDDYDFKPCQMLRSRYFYMMWCMFLLTGQGITFVSTLYKAYGQTFIPDDRFLSLVGTCAAIFNGSGRIFWGMIADKYSFRLAILFVNAIFTCLMLTLQLTPLGGRILFLIYICLLFGSFSGCYCLFPTATTKCYGRKYMAINYGLVFSNQIITPPLGVFTFQLLTASIGWTGLFYLVAACSFISLLLAVSFNAKDRNGNEI